MSCTWWCSTHGVVMVQVIVQMFLQIRRSGRQQRVSICWGIGSDTGGPHPECLRSVVVIILIMFNSSLSSHNQLIPDSIRHRDMLAVCSDACFYFAPIPKYSAIWTKKVIDWIFPWCWIPLCLCSPILSSADQRLIYTDWSCHCYRVHGVCFSCFFGRLNPEESLQTSVEW